MKTEQEVRGAIASNVVVNRKITDGQGVTWSIGSKVYQKEDVQELAVIIGKALGIIVADN